MFLNMTFNLFDRMNGRATDPIGIEEWLITLLVIVMFWLWVRGDENGY